LTDKTRFSLTPDQQNAIDGIVDDIQKPAARIVLCGYAGTGKTVTTAALVSRLREESLSVVVATPTHKARSQVEKALNNYGATGFNCVTVHRLLGLKQVRDYKTGKESFKPDSPGKNMLADGFGNCVYEDYLRERQFYENWTEYKKKHAIKIDIVIVDETSMLHKELYDYLIQEAGSRPIVFVGDDRQLLPVKEDKVCEAFVDCESIYRLTKVLRHDGVILNLATATRKLPIGRARFDSCSGGGSRVIAYCRRDEWMNSLLDVMCLPEALANPDYCRALAFTNKAVEDMNQKIHFKRYGINADQFIPGMGCITVDAIPDPTGGAPLLNSTIEISIHEAEVDFFKAPHDEQHWARLKTWLLVVSSFDSDNKVQIRVLDREYEKQWKERQNYFASSAKQCKDLAERKEWWSMFFERKDQIGKVEPISALTIHKSQGSTFKHVFLHWSIDGWSSTPTSLQNQLAYVGITRASDSLHVLKDWV